jgi:hypothetical protein
LFASPIRTRHPWYVIALALALSAFSAGYTERHFAIKTDVNELISPDLPWVQRVKAFLRAFPQREILVVVDAPTPEFVEQAATSGDVRSSVAIRGKADVLRTSRFGRDCRVGPGNFTLGLSQIRT